MDGIVLARLIHDVNTQIEKEDGLERAGREAAERARALWKENNPTVPAASVAPVSPGQYRGVNAGSSIVRGDGSGGGGGGGHSRVPSGESRVPEVFLKGLNLGGKSREERVNENCSVRDLRERIKGMKKWRREIERTVYWQREEYGRVQKAFSKQSDQGDGSDGAEKVVVRRVVQFQEGGSAGGKGKEKEGAEPVKETGVQHEEGWGVGGQTWEKKRSVNSCFLVSSMELWMLTYWHLVVECPASPSGRNCSVMAGLDGMTKVFVASISDAENMRVRYRSTPIDSLTSIEEVSLCAGSGCWRSNIGIQH